MARLRALAIALLLLAPLIVASRLSPDPRGVGTHEQLELLGLTRCPFLASTGNPCATCGMTTSFSHAAHGNLIASFVAQPFAMLLALGCSMGFWIAIHQAAFDSRAARPLAFLTRPRAMWTLTALCLLAWGYKILTHEAEIPA